jgi:hypothetical protein
MMQFTERKKKTLTEHGKEKKVLSFQKTRSHWIEENMDNEKKRIEIESSCVKLNCAVFRWKIQLHGDSFSLAVLVPGPSPDYTRILASTRVQI